MRTRGSVQQKRNSDYENIESKSENIARMNPATTTTSKRDAKRQERIAEASTRIRNKNQLQQQRQDDAANPAKLETTKGSGKKTTG